MRTSVWVSFCLGVALTPALALSSSNDRTTFIELSPHVKWQVVNDQALNPDQLSKWGAIPAVDAEYGVKNADLRTYVRRGIRIDAIVEEAADPSAAYGLLTFYETTGMKPLEGVDLAVLDSQRALMVRNNFFVRVPLKAAGAPSEADLRSLLTSIGGAKPSAASLELMPTPLPSKGMIPGTEKYVLGPEASTRAITSIPADLLGFSQGAEVHVESYARSGGRVTLTVIGYPTPQIADLRFKVMQTQLSLSPVGQAGQAFGKRDGSYVFLVQRSGSVSSAQAVALLNEFTVAKSVTPYEKLPSKPVAVQMLELIIANILLITYLVGMAFVGGIMIVVSRRLLAKLFPESTWVHAGENSLIQLHLGGQ